MSYYPHKPPIETPWYMLLAMAFTLMSMLVWSSVLTGCEGEQPEIQSLQVEGECTLAVDTDQGKAAVAAAYVGMVDLETEEVTSCLVVTLDVLWETQVGEVDLYLKGVPPTGDLDGDGVDDIPAECYAEGGPGPFEFRPRPAAP